ncbi:hypothetical protein [Pleurocapsa sp. PCC 7319]|uniref:hypothetical protein n=1 Tax=Pleurocapsa sp. PCC 7319 TaxID=118161 RepID=UPI00034B5F85|nr:hypothetical protein [Pleurocapsa sp. PCC 7319]
MAKISNEFKSTLEKLQQALLLIVDDSKVTEYMLLERYGETNQTAVVLDELTEIAQQAADLYVQISRLLLRTAEIQPTITPDMLGLLTDRVATISNRVPALERSVQEIKADWGLS